MKKLKLLFSFFVIISYTTSAQDLQSVQRFIAVNDYEGARHQIDSMLHDKKHQQEAAPWFYKGKIYTEIVRRHDTLSAGLLQQALQAYKRYQQLDSQNTMMALDNNVGLFQLYDLCYNNGVNHYNNGNYEDAYHFFQNALETEEYIAARKFAFNGKTFPVVDTQLISLTAFSAYLSNNEEASIPYFSRLADMKLNGAEYKGVYTLLYQYYQRRNDAARATKYLNTGRQLFEDDDYWIKLELGNPRNIKDRFTRYEQMLLKYPANFTLCKNYSIDLFNHVYADEKPADYTMKQERLQQLLTRLIRLDDSSALAHYIMSQHVQNQLYELEEQHRMVDGDSPADENKKKLLQTKINEKYRDLQVHSLKAYELYAPVADETNMENRRKLLQQLISCYRKKKENERVDFYMQRLNDL